ncbi:MAG: hypothetical protein QXD27_09405 [Metallosphaera sp.]
MKLITFIRLTFLFFGNVKGYVRESIKAQFVVVWNLMLREAFESVKSKRKEEVLILIDRYLSDEIDEREFILSLFRFYPLYSSGFHVFSLREFALLTGSDVVSPIYVRD